MFDFSTLQDVQANEARRATRHPCKRITTSHGRPLNLSSVGIRIRHKGRPRIDIDDTLELTIKTDDDSVQISGRVVWIMKIGFRRHDMGLEFVDVSGDVQRQLDGMIDSLSKT